MTLCDSVAMASAQVRGVLSLGPIVVLRQESTPAFSNPAPIADPRLDVSDRVIVSDQPMTWTRQRRPDERDNRLSPVTRTASSSSASATYAASYGVRFCRSSQQRVISC